ncbi:MAG: GNAT family N-acetyltransferase [Thaumarchaeota archaeon]|nr:GNAT family N-acetyltransferase [Nitrososphaerota archaeon]
MVSSWRARRYDQGDDSKINDLLQATFPGYEGIERWDWICKHGPMGFHGPEGDIWVAETESGDLVGYYAKVRYPVRYFGRSVLASQGLNMATHPQFRGQGIATQLLTSANVDAEKNGIVLNFGFPNDMSSPIVSKFSHFDLGSLDELHLILDPGAYVNAIGRNRIRRFLRRVNLALKASRISRSDITTAVPPDSREGFTGEVDSIWNSIRDRFDLGLERKRQYLTWRYDPRWGDYEVRCARNGDETLGYVVTGMTTKRGRILMRIYELIAKDDDARTYTSMLDATIRRSSGLGSAYISISASMSEGCLASLRDMGFRRFGKRGRYMLHSYQSDHDLQLQQARVYHSFGDRDYL